MKETWGQFVNDLRSLVKNPACLIVCIYAVYVGFRMRRGALGQEELLTTVSGLLTCILFVFLGEAIKRNQVLDLLKVVARREGATQTYATWDVEEIRSIVCHARKTIKIVDTFFDEAAHLSTQIQSAIENGADHIKLDVYMLSPDRPFGGQRLREIDPAKEKIAASELEAEYRRKFNDCVSSLIQRFGKMKRVTMAVWENYTMPSVRLLAIDDREYFVGWFPINAVNPLHSCQGVRGNNELSQPLVKDIRGELEAIHVHSRLIYSSDGGQLPLLQLEPLLHRP
jgi:hypothetical protein